MIDITSYLTAMIMLLGLIVGTLISPRISNHIGTQYSRRDLIFKKKLEYFEKIIETIEKNKRTYNQAICRIEEAKNSREIGKITEDMKKNRKNFLILASPLYFDTRKMSEKIVHFVRVEKEIFNRISSLENKDKKEMIVLTEQLRKHIEILSKRGKEILIEMRKELAR